MSKLSDNKIKAAKVKTKAYTLNDGLGLMLKVNANGSKLWYFRFYFHNKQQLISLGRYPEICLSDARKLREQAREYVAKGIDPRHHLLLKKNKKENTKEEKQDSEAPLFSDYVLYWKKFKIHNLYIGREAALKRRQSTIIQIERYLRKDLVPGLGKMHLNEIKPKHVLAVLRKIEDRNATSIAEKCRFWLNEIFRLAVAEGHIEMNPAAEMKAAARANPH